jgi:hypothetical protein
MNYKNIFFSYSRADGSEFALRLALDLQQEGFNVWIDQQDIRAGSEWDLEIEKALETCDCLLFIESERSVTSTNVLDEVYYALDQNKPVIPVILTDSKTPFRIKRLQHIDFTASYERGFRHLLQELKVPRVAEAINGNEGPHPLKQATQELRKWMPVMVGIMTVALLTAAFLFFTRSTPGNVQTAQEVVTPDTMATKIPDTTAAVVPTETEAIIPAAPILKPGKPSRKTQAEVARAQKQVMVPVSSASLVPEDFAGRWELSDVEPAARGHRGYLNIEAVDEKKVKILSSFQFSFFKTNDTAYFQVFNGFAGCAACELKSEIPITDNDVAFGAQIYKILRADKPGEGKAGDTVMTIGPNSSIRASVTLHPLNKNSVQIKVQKQVATPISYGLVVPPFVYTFRFTRNTP